MALRHPKLEISCIYSDQVVDIVGEGLDAAVRIGRLADSNLIARRISAIRMVTVASPAYLEQRGIPRTPADLAGHDAIPHGNESWRFLKDGRIYTHRPRGRFIADSAPAELAGLIAGLGIAVMPVFAVVAALKRGRIVSILDEYEVPNLGLYIVRPPPAEPLPRKIRVLTEMMQEAFGSPGWEEEGPGYQR